MRIVKDSSFDRSSSSKQFTLPILNFDAVTPTIGTIAYDTIYNSIVYGNGSYWSKVGGSAGDVIILPAVNIPDFQPISGGSYLFQNTNGATPTLLTILNSSIDRYGLQVGEQISWGMRGNLLSPGSCGSIIAGGPGQPLVAARYNGGIVPHNTQSDGAFFSLICTAPGVYTLFSS
jgi:hypothetical protein